MNVEVNSIPPDLMTTAPVEMDKPDPTDMSHTDQVDHLRFLTPKYLYHARDRSQITDRL